MAIAAHPDDIESWCAGTLARAVDQGAVVRLLLVTSGEHGSSDPLLQAQEVATRREEEARKAAEILGIAEVVFLRSPRATISHAHTSCTTGRFSSMAHVHWTV